MMMMWGTVFTIFLCIGSSYAITAEQCAKFDYLSTCSGNLQEAFKAAQEQSNATVACSAIGTYMNCVEYVACECQLTRMSNVHNQLTYIAGIYTYQSCENITGPLIMNRGIPCSVNGSGTPTEGELLVLSTATTDIVLELEETCNGIQPCYAEYDTEAALALHARNLTTLCGVLKSTITCLENASCACGESTNANLTNNVKSNHDIYRQTCNIITPKILEKDSIICSGNGTVEEQTVCHSDNPVYVCYTNLATALQARGNTKEVRCPSLRRYIECTEHIACQCGLIRSPAVYRAVTVAVASFNDSVCSEISEPLVVVSGMDCPEGTGTTEDEDRLIIALSEDPSVVELDDVCPGIKACYADLDEASGIALFQKNIKKLCAGQKIFIECMEETYCQCGFYNFDNTTVYLNYQRENHVSACFTDSVLRKNFKCEYGSIGFNCMDNSDCKVISGSKCSSEGKCTCNAGYIYIPDEDTTACVKDMRGTLGHPCSSGYDCQLVDHSECGTSGSCACKTGYKSENSVCMKEDLKGGIGYRCSSDSDCKGITNSRCGTGGLCICQPGYVSSDNNCKPVSSGRMMKATYGLLAGLLMLYMAVLL